jgi:hypothetical protein
MKRTSIPAQRTRLGGAAKRSRPARGGRIHPVVIYPFKQPTQYGDLKALYQLVARLAGEPERYARPLTVMDRKTYRASAGNTAFQTFRKQTVARYSDILDEWCVDTCQMWYIGLGQAFEQGRPGDVYWLIPGDFNYGTAVGQEVLGRLHDLPEIIEELNQDICIGEISTDHNNSKQLIDTYGTFALLYNWFPAAAREIRQFTERPRSEFFAVRHSFLAEALAQRWYPYEQTVVMLLQAVFTKRRISRFCVGNISDLPEGREPLTSVVQQVERAERVLKSVWRERNQTQKDWITKYRQLEAESGQVRKTALTILQNALR